MTDVEKLAGATLKAGNTEPNLRVQLLEEDGDPKNLTGFTASVVVVEPNGDTPVVDSSMTVVDEGLGIVEYDWQSSDTGTAGFYDAEVTITDGTDTITYPNHRYFTIRIMETL